MGFKNLEEITAWQLACQVKVCVDRFLARPAFRRSFKCFDQLHDSVRSAPRNIAEGHARGFKHKEFARFLRIAKGSLSEVINHVRDAEDQGLITADERVSSERLAKRSIKALNRLLEYLESTPDPPPPGSTQGTQGTKGTKGTKL